VKSDKDKGFTLIEVMIALVVMLFVFLALLQTALLSIDSNMRNVLRDEAVRIAEERMNEARNLSFDSLASDTNPLPANSCPNGFPTEGELIEREFRNIASFDFCTNVTVDDLDSDNKQVTITVGWVWKGEDYTHSITTIVRNP
jgi:type IV pilus assembly protein PilV